MATASGLNTSGDWHDRRHLSDRPADCRHSADEKPRHGTVPLSMEQHESRTLWAPHLSPPPSAQGEGLIRSPSPVVGREAEAQDSFDSARPIPPPRPRKRGRAQPSRGARSWQGSALGSRRSMAVPVSLRSTSTVRRDAAPGDVLPPTRRALTAEHGTRRSGITARRCAAAVGRVTGLPGLAARARWLGRQAQSRCSILSCDQRFRRHRRARAEKRKPDGRDGERRVGERQTPPTQRKRTVSKATRAPSATAVRSNSGRAAATKQGVERTTPASA